MKTEPRFYTNKAGTNVHYFESLEEFLPHVSYESVKAAYDKFGDSWRVELGKWDNPRDSDTRWAGGLTQHAAYKLAKEGMSMDAEALEIRDTINTAVKPMLGDMFTWDVTGSMVDVGAFLSGEPECMLTTREDVTRARKVVNIVYNVCVSANVDAKTIRLRGLAMMALVDSLESTHRFRVNLYFACASGMSRNSDDANGALVVRLLDPSHRYDPQAVGFALTHPCMFRRCCFNYWNTLSREHADIWGVDNWGYGYPATLRKLPEEIEDSESFAATECLHSGVQNMYEVHDMPSAIKWVKTQMARLVDGDLM